jgi:hypothetical protein
MIYQGGRLWFALIRQGFAIRRRSDLQNVGGVGQAAGSWSHLDGAGEGCHGCVGIPHKAILGIDPVRSKKGSSSRQQQARRLHRCVTFVLSDLIHFECRIGTLGIIRCIIVDCTLGA